jgi:hypothetical protein
MLISVQIFKFNWKHKSLLVCEMRLLIFLYTWLGVVHEGCFAMESGWHLTIVSHNKRWYFISSFPFLSRIDVTPCLFCLFSFYSHSRNTETSLGGYGMAIWGSKTLIWGSLILFSFALEYFGIFEFFRIRRGNLKIHISVVSPLRVTACLCLIIMFYKFGFPKFTLPK